MAEIHGVRSSAECFERAEFASHAEVYDEGMSKIATAAVAALWSIAGQLACIVESNQEGPR